MFNDRYICSSSEAVLQSNVRALVIYDVDFEMCNMDCVLHLSCQVKALS